MNLGTKWVPISDFWIAIRQRLCTILTQLSDRKCRGSFETPDSQSASTVEASVEGILNVIPRLATVAFRTAISFGLHLGANRSLAETAGDDHVIREIIEGYRADAAMMAVIR